MSFLPFIFFFLISVNFSGTYLLQKVKKDIQSKYQNSQRCYRSPSAFSHQGRRESLFAGGFCSCLLATEECGAWGLRALLWKCLPLLQTLALGSFSLPQLPSTSRLHVFPLPKVSWTSKIPLASLATPPWASGLLTAPAPMQQHWKTQTPNSIF